MTIAVTGKKYKIQGQLSCNNINVIYFITCSACNDLYVGYAVKFKKRFRVHKSDITTCKYRYGVAKHFIFKVPGIRSGIQTMVQRKVLTGSAVYPLSWDE